MTPGLPQLPHTLVTAAADPAAGDSIGTPTLWAVTIVGVLPARAVDFLVTRRPHEVSMQEAIGWSAFYIALPLAFGGWVWSRYGSPAGVEYLHRLPRREVALRRQPVRLHAAAGGVRGARRARSSGCCSTASSARWCCAAVFIALGAAVLQTFDLDVPAVRRRPARHRRSSCCATPCPGHDHDVDIVTMRTVRLLRRVMPVDGRVPRHRG